MLVSRPSLLVSILLLVLNIHRTQHAEPEVCWMSAHANEHCQIKIRYVTLL